MDDFTAAFWGIIWGAKRALKTNSPKPTKELPEVGSQIGLYSRFERKLFPDGLPASAKYYVKYVYRTGRVEFKVLDNGRTISEGHYAPPEEYYVLNI